MSRGPERILARISSADICDVYNGMIGLSVCFDYEDGLHQCLGGYILNAALVVRFMRAVGVDALSKCKGRSCWVTHTHDKILSIEPLHKKDGRPFVISEWQEWVNLPGNGGQLSWYDLEGR